MGGLHAKTERDSASAMIAWLHERVRQKNDQIADLEALVGIAQESIRQKDETIEAVRELNDAKHQSLLYANERVAELEEALAFADQMTVREHQRIVAAEGRGAMSDELMVENTILRAELKAAERDTRRLDWMQTNLQSVLPWACIGGEFGEIDWRDETMFQVVNSGK